MEIFGDSCVLFTEKRQQSSSNNLKGANVVTSYSSGNYEIKKKVIFEVKLSTYKSVDF